MRFDRYRLPLVAALSLGLAGSALAQQAPAPQPAPAADAPAAPAPAADDAAKPAQTGTAAPAPGTDGNPAAPEVREIVKDTFGDWQVRCTPDGKECFLYQLAADSNKNPVAEVSLIKLPKGGEAVAGVTVVSPLGTLLTQGVGLQIDNSEMRQYPFNWCSQVGCFARFGLTDQTIAALKRGKSGRLVLVSVGAPEHPLALDLSLKGFTAAFDALETPPAPPGAPVAPATGGPAAAPAAANPAPLALPAK